ncbi:MAG: hypothetical protein OYL92_15765 [Acidobacteriota bacterium]|nr:hypothetical protein [Acidobacteriota bacterium]MDE3266425.1 hypothetical protein [Acidobacteriota bacterium]
MIDYGKFNKAIERRLLRSEWHIPFGFPVLAVAALGAAYVGLPLLFAWNPGLTGALLIVLLLAGLVWGFGRLLVSFHALFFPDELVNQSIRLGKLVSEGVFSGYPLVPHHDNESEWEHDDSKIRQFIADFTVEEDKANEEPQRCRDSGHEE